MRTHLVDPFAESMMRQPIFDKWVERRGLIGAVITVEYEWVNGSFVTTKRDPSDIDVVLFVFKQEYEALEDRDKKALDELAGPPAKRTWKCDSRVIPMPAVTDQAIYGGTLEDQRYWLARGYWENVWSHDRLLGEKGFLEVREP